MKTPCNLFFCESRIGFSHNTVVYKRPTFYLPNIGVICDTTSGKHINGIHSLKELFREHMVLSMYTVEFKERIYL